MRVCWSILFQFCFFFQAEDGIRDLTVTGVQTCALPIFLHQALGARAGDIGVALGVGVHDLYVDAEERLDQSRRQVGAFLARRSEERRVGKECRSRWSPYH